MIKPAVFDCADLASFISQQCAVIDGKMVEFGKSRTLLSIAVRLIVGAGFMWLGMTGIKMPLRAFGESLRIAPFLGFSLPCYQSNSHQLQSLYPVVFNHPYAAAIDDRREGLWDG